MLSNTLTWYVQYYDSRFVRIMSVYPWRDSSSIWVYKFYLYSVTLNVCYSVYRVKFRTKSYYIRFNYFVIYVPLVEDLLFSLDTALYSTCFIYIPFAPDMSIKVQQLHVLY